VKRYRRNCTIRRQAAARVTRSPGVGTIEYQFRVTQSRARKVKRRMKWDGIAGRRGRGREGEERRERRRWNRSAFRAELVHTNFLIPPRSLASGCVTGAHAACCVVLSSSVLSLPLFLWLVYLFLPSSSAGACTRAPPFTYITTKDRQFYTYRRFFNREKGRRGACTEKKERTRERADPCSLTMARQMPAVFHSPEADCLYSRNWEYGMQEVTYPVRSIAQGVVRDTDTRPLRVHVEFDHLRDAGRALELS